MSKIKMTTDLPKPAPYELPTKAYNYHVRRPRFKETEEKMKYGAPLAGMDWAMEEVERANAAFRNERVQDAQKLDDGIILVRLSSPFPLACPWLALTTLFFALSSTRR